LKGHVQAFGELPDWLRALVDPVYVRSELGAVLPQVRTGELEILACHAERLRLQRDGWAGQYEVTVRDIHDAQPRLIRLEGTTAAPDDRSDSGGSGAAAFGDETWLVHLPDLKLTLRTERPDVALPALRLLTDPATALDLVEGALRDTNPRFNGFRVRSCVPRILRHKRGSRCTVLLNLEYPRDLADRGWPAVVVAKAYDGDEGQTAWEGMRALSGSALASSGVAIGEPLAFVRDLNVLLQSAIGEETNLKKVIRQTVQNEVVAGREMLSGQLASTAAGLAALHDCEVSEGQLITWEDQLADVRGVIEQLATFVPGLAAAANPLLQQLSRIAAAYPTDAVGPAHGSFRPDQVLLTGGAAGFIDFDGFCQAEPAMDLALFRTTVQQLGRQPEHVLSLAQIANEFLAEYRQHRGVSGVRLALWESLDLLKRVLNCWTKVYPDKLPAAMSALENQLAAEPLLL
jgi:hypothetical protein